MGLTTTGLHFAPLIYLLVITVLATSGKFALSAPSASTTFDSLSDASKAAVISLLNEASDTAHTDPLNLIRLGLEKANENKERLARQDSPNISEFLPTDDVSAQEASQKSMPQRLTFDALDGDDAEGHQPNGNESNVPVNNLAAINNQQQHDEEQHTPMSMPEGWPSESTNEMPHENDEYAAGNHEQQAIPPPHEANSRGFSDEPDTSQDQQNSNTFEGYHNNNNNPYSNEHVLKSSSASASAGGGVAAASASASSGDGASIAASSSASPQSVPIGDFDGDGDVDENDASAAAAAAASNEPEEHEPQGEHVEQHHNPYAQAAQNGLAATMPTPTQAPESHAPSYAEEAKKKKKKKRRKRKNHGNVYKDSYIDRSNPNNPQLVKIKSKKRVGPDGVTEEHFETRTSVLGDPNSYSRSSTSYSSSSSSSSRRHHIHGDWKGGAHNFNPQMPSMPAMPQMAPMTPMTPMAPMAPMMSMPQMPAMPQMPPMPQMPQMQPMAPFGFNMNPMSGYWMPQPGATTAFSSSMGGVPTTYTSGNGFAGSFASAGDNLSYDMGWPDRNKHGRSRNRKRSKGRH